MTTQNNNQYEDREIDELDFAGGYYTRHVNAMTVEGLNSKSAIAGELAFRDHTIDQLKQKIVNLEAQLEEACEHCEELQERLDNPTQPSWRF